MVTTKVQLTFQDSCIFFFVFADDELSDTVFNNIIPASPEALKTLHAPATNNFVQQTQPLVYSFVIGEESSAWFM